MNHERNKGGNTPLVRHWQCFAFKVSDRSLSLNARLAKVHGKVINSSPNLSESRLLLKEKNWMIILVQSTRSLEAKVHHLMYLFKLFTDRSLQFSAI